jgi:hypothetical protein
MPRLTETVHHASGTYEKGTVLSADHPLVKAGPHLFVADEPVVAAKPAKPAKVKAEG